MRIQSLVATVFACTTAVVLPSPAAQAQSASGKSPAFYVAEFEVTDPEGIRPYSAAVESTFSPFGGRYVVRGGQVRSLEGEGTKRIIMIAFPSLDQAQAWYDSSAYGAIRPIRHQSAKAKVFIVEGLPTPPN